MQMMHHRLIKILIEVVEEAGVTKASVVVEARGLRPGDATRLGDIVVMDFAEIGRHLIVDAGSSPLFTVTTSSQRLRRSRGLQPIGWKTRR